MKLALKVDVDTYRGTREGVPRLVELLKREGAGATFLFSLGPDHTGRAIRRAFRPGFMRKVSRTSVLEHYGLRTLLYGTLLPGPDIGVRCAAQMRAVREAGFECGIHTWDHVAWQDRLGSASAEWTRAEMQRAYDRYEEVFGVRARAHGAAGWQLNVHALRNVQRLAFGYSSDTRGAHPFIPTYNAELIACPQVPTTLPTLDELIGRDGLTADSVADHLLDLTAREAPATGHVYTLHAELEGNRLAPAFERLLAGWKAQGYELLSLRDYCDGLELEQLPHHEIVFGEVPGRSGMLALQGPAFLDAAAGAPDYRWSRDRAVITQHAAPPAEPAASPTTSPAT
ncbi:MAG: 4-deoxy-4-formamido-L-arabinose-phosphoundecaprenol deformylase [Proteobacteria bacterium]|nr:4-deoxy-4-formamido-L-arabinose-phosphoundecaprenol deformylase [Burkholderiales bacterium]